MFRDILLHIPYVIRAYAVSLAVMLVILFALVAIFYGGSFDGMDLAWMLAFIIYLMAPINALFIGLCHWIGLNKKTVEKHWVDCFRDSGIYFIMVYILLLERHI